MRKGVLLPVIAACFLVLTMVTMLAGNVTYQFISDIHKTHQDLQVLSCSGIELESTAIVPKITPGQAVAEVTNYQLNNPQRPRGIVVEYYQLTNPSITAFSDSAKQKNRSLSQYGYLFKSPCYIVSFEGITRSASTPFGMPGVTFHEDNVVIDANSGEALFGFSYR